MKNRCTITQLSAVLLLTLTACQQPMLYSPIVDMKKVNLDKYAADLAECKKYGAEVQDKTVQSGLLLAAAGAGIGAMVGSQYGMTGEGASYGGVMGATYGTARGESEYSSEVRAVVDNCLIGRGYKVLGKRS